MCTYWNKVSLKKSTTKNTKRIDSIGIGLASPEEIRNWGERRLPSGTLVGKVDKDHTVDYESLKPIEGGLFCERIFGPVEDFYCSCERRGEKNEKFCPDCEVEFTKSRVRRTRMGYIPLAVPVAHVWYLRGRPSYIANLIGKSRNTVDKLAYGETLCESFVGNTSTNYLKHGLEHLSESENCRLLNFHLSNSNAIKLELLLTPLGSKQKIGKKKGELHFNQRLFPEKNFFEWRSSYLKLVGWNLLVCEDTTFKKKVSTNQHENLSFEEGVGEQVDYRSTPVTIKLHSNPAKSSELPVYGSTPLEKNNFLFANSFYDKFPGSKQSLHKPFYLKLPVTGKNQQAINTCLSVDEENNSAASNPEGVIKKDFTKNSPAHFNSSIEQVGVTSPFLQKFFQVAEDASLITGYFKNAIDEIKFPRSAKVLDLVTKSIKTSRNKQLEESTKSHNQIDSLKHDGQPFISVVKNLQYKSNGAALKNVKSTLGLGQWNSDNQYPYKKDKQSLSNGLMKLSASVTCHDIANKVESRTGKKTEVTNGQLPKVDVNKKSSFITPSTAFASQGLENFENPLQVKYNKFHTLPIFSTFIYKEWLHRFSFLEYFIWSPRENDLAIPFYTRRTSCHMARISSMNSIRNKIGLEKTPKQFLFAFNGCTRNISWNQRQIEEISKPFTPFGVNEVKKRFHRETQISPPHFKKSSEQFVELRDKKVSLSFSLDSNNVTKRSTIANMEENSMPVMEKSPSNKIIFRQIKNFFKWKSSLSPEKTARKRYVKPRASTPVEKSMTFGDLTTPNSLKFENLQALTGTSKGVYEKYEKPIGYVNNFSKVRQVNMIQDLQKQVGVDKKRQVSLASGNFSQLEASNGNQQQNSRWQESSLMWGKVDDTQQFPRLTELLHFTGGTALRHLLSRFHLVLLGKFLRHELKNLELKVNFLLSLKMLTYSQGLLLGKLAKRRSKQIRRLKLLELFQCKKSNPEWMILSVLPVLPPDLRPILRVNDDFVVASDLNRLYQTVLRRNNTIHERLDDPLPCPESGLFRQRSLQKAVDGLLENGKGGGTPLCASKRRPLVSLSHVLKGKKGLFRQHLLGKRVDYSGRSVIVVGPKLNLHECGLPKEMALELFQPFLIHRLKVKGLATSNTAARRMIQQEDPIIWHTVKQLVYEHPVLLNRAPTLHRLGIQAFQPRLVSGRAILLHPLVCNGFNADFDGDQMAVHVPLSFQARAEAWKIMWSKNNLLSPATGQPILVPSQDMVLGCYYLSVIVPRVSKLPSYSPECQSNTSVFDNGADAKHTPSGNFKDNEKTKSSFFNSLPCEATPGESMTQSGVLFHNMINLVDQKKVAENAKPMLNNSNFNNVNHFESTFTIPSKTSDCDREWSPKEIAKGVNLKKVLPLKSSVSIHPPGFFKKTQHLGFLTDANLLEKMVEREVSQEIPEEKPWTKFSPTSFTSAKFFQLLDPPRLAKAVTPLGVTPSGVTPLGVTPSGVTPLGVTPSGVTPLGVTPSGVTPLGVTPSGVTPLGVTPSGVTPLGVTPSGVTPLGVTPSGVTPLGVTPSGVTPLGVTPSGVTPLGVTPSGVTPLGVTPSGVTPLGVTPSGVTPLGVTPSGVTPLGVTPSGVTPLGVRGLGGPSGFKAFYPFRVNAKSKIFQGKGTIMNSPVSTKIPDWNQKLPQVQSRENSLLDVQSNFSNSTSTYNLKTGHYFSSLEDSLMAYSQGRLQTHTPFWVRLDSSAANIKKEPLHSDDKNSSPFLKGTVVPSSIKLLSQSQKRKKRVVEVLPREPQYGCSQELSRILFQDDQHEIVIEGNDTLEPPLELRLGADGNLVKILTTFQYNYGCNATILDQCKEKSIRYMRTTAGRVVINETLFHF